MAAIAVKEKIGVGHFSMSPVGQFLVSLDSLDAVVFFVGLTLAHSLLIPGALKYFARWRETEKRLDFSLWWGCLLLALFVGVILYVRFLTYFVRLPI